MVAGAVGGLLLGGLLGGIGAAAERRQATRVRRRTRRAVQAARAFAQQRVGELTGEGSLFRLGENFLRETFDPESGGGPLAEDFARSLRAQQAARGTFATGQAAAAQEAIGQSALAQRLRASLLPQVQQFSFAPLQQQLQIEQVRTPFEIQAAVGQGFGPTILGGITSGALGGLQLGLQLENLNLLRQQQQLGAQPSLISSFGGGAAIGSALGPSSTFSQFGANSGVLGNPFVRGVGGFA